MSNPTIFLEGLALTTDNLEQMVSFYNKVLGASLRPIEVGAITLYEGYIGDLSFTLVPKNPFTRTGQKNGYQLSIFVTDMNRIVSRVHRAGGIQAQEIQHFNGSRYCGIIDPDGNSIELREVDTATQYT